MPRTCGLRRGPTAVWREHVGRRLLLTVCLAATGPCRVGAWRLRHGAPLPPQAAAVPPAPCAAGVIRRRAVRAQLRRPLLLRGGLLNPPRTMCAPSPRRASRPFHACLGCKQLAHCSAGLVMSTPRCPPSVPKAEAPAAPGGELRYHSCGVGNGGAPSAGATADGGADGRRRKCWHERWSRCGITHRAAAGSRSSTGGPARVGTGTCRATRSGTGTAYRCLAAASALADESGCKPLRRC